ncbi:hypothetical protein [Streptomyces sp. NPDC056527]|uniref:hypothetical protein n=1 Tax=Streptomyces sp. NPDC056527 TaxID=3345853 RepID=UPI0036B4BEDE
MSAVRIPAVRKIVRQFAIAMVACTAVAGGAALAAAPETTPASISQQAGAENDWPKAPTPSPVAPTN